MILNYTRSNGGLISRTVDNISIVKEVNFGKINFPLSLLFVYISTVDTISVLILDSHVNEINGTVQFACD